MDESKEEMVPPVLSGSDSVKPLKFLKKILLTGILWIAASCNPMGLTLCYLRLQPRLFSRTVTKSL